MNITSTLTPKQAGPRVAVSAYIDGKSAQIESMKLDAVDRLEISREASDGALAVTIDGLRHSRTKDALLFTALGVLPTVAATAAGYSLAGIPGALAGGVAGTAAALLPSTFFLGRALKAPQWTPGSRLSLGETAKPSPVKEAGPQKLRSLVDESRAHYPDARQILFLSGHGNRTEVAHMNIAEMGRAMQGSKLDATIVDACLVGQLEAITHMTPWAGMIMVSPHKIKARGLELPNILSSKNLLEPNLKTSAVDMAREAKSTTPSFATIDSEQFQKSFLPALDQLGRDLQKVDASAVKSALGKSLGTDGFLSRRVDMGSFLHQLKAARLAPEATEKALEAFKTAVPFQKNEYSFSFDLKAGRSESSLPEGWRDFLTAVDRRYKPLWG